MANWCVLLETNVEALPRQMIVTVEAADADEAAAAGWREGYVVASVWVERAREGGLIT